MKGQRGAIAGAVASWCCAAGIRGTKKQKASAKYFNDHN